MKCPVCGSDSSVSDTRSSGNLVTRRRRLCELGHAFTTYEVHAEVFCSAKARAADFANTVAKRVETRLRDIEIAKSLHTGWRNLAEKFGINKSAVYLAARRGRRYMGMK